MIYVKRAVFNFLTKDPSLVVAVVLVLRLRPVTTEQLWFNRRWVRESGSE